MIAVTGPRSAATDELLADQDQLVLVVPPDEDARLTELVRHGLAECGVPLAVRGPLVDAGRPHDRPRGVGPAEGAGMTRARTVAVRRRGNAPPSRAFATR